MHAYLIQGQDPEVLKAEVENLLAKLKTNPLEFPLAKIEDTRALNSFLKLKLTSPTAIIINSIEGATSEAANAFLKNLEEPQEDLYFILTTESVHKVLPTIVSRCQVIKTSQPQTATRNTEAEKFLEMTLGEKFAFIDQIRDRGEAKVFVRDLINALHESLHEKGHEFSELADNLEIAQKTLENLEANGNVTLQLANLVIKLN